MVVLGMHQSTLTTLSVGSRVLPAITPLVLAYEDVSRMDFGVEENFLAKVRTREVERILLLFPTFAGRPSGKNSYARQSQ